MNTTVSDLQEAANELIERGRQILLLSHDKVPYGNCGDCKNKSDAAHRATCGCLASRKMCHGFYAATADKDVLAGWLEEHQDCTTIAVRTGRESGIFVMEFDPKNGGTESYRKLVEKHGEIETETNQSPSGGLHFVFRMPNFDFGAILGKLWPGIDIKAADGYHVVPPSVTTKGEYTVTKAVDPQPAPDWLLDAIKDYLTKNKWNTEARQLKIEEQRTYDVDKLSDSEREHVEKTVTYWTRRISSAPDGTQNVLIYTGSRVLFSLCFSGMLDEEEAQTALEEACDGGGHPRNRSLLAIDSGKRAAFSDPDPIDRALTNDINLLGTFTRDDIGNANRVVFWRGQDLRFDPVRERFFYWADTRWVYARDGHIRSVVEDVHSRIASTEGPFYDDFAIPPHEKDKKAPKTYKELLIEWSNSQRYANKIKDTMGMLKGRDTLWCESDDFDVEPYIFNVANGVIDLKTGELMPHERSFMCSKISKEMKYDPDAKCPEFLRFLRLVQPKKEHREYLQRMMGYSLIGEVGRDQIFALHIGAGGNGKGVFLDCCKHTMGEYATAGQRDTFVRKANANRIPADIASYEGMRMVLVDELNEGKLDDGLLKEITGGGTIKAEAKMMNPWEYTPKFTLHFRTNVMPDLPADQAILRRFRPVKWDVKPSSEEWDSFTDAFNPTVLQYLTKKEGPGILNWMLEGTRQYLEKGLLVPRDLQEEAVGMLEEGDPFLIFMQQNVQKAPGGRLEGSKLYKAFKDWYGDMGYHGSPPSARSIFKDIRTGKYHDKWDWKDERAKLFLIDIQIGSLLTK